MTPALKAMVEAMAANDELTLAIERFVAVSRAGLSVMGAAYAEAIVRGHHAACLRFDAILKEQP